MSPPRIDPLSEAALVERLRGGPVRFALDTNQAWGQHHLEFGLDLRRLADTSLQSHAFIVPSLVVGERLRQIAQRKGDRYVAETALQTLEDVGLTPVGHEQDDGIHFAGLLTSWYPNPDDWDAVKRQWAADQLGVAGPVNDRRVSATVDWAIFAQADRHGWVLLTADKGPEFKSLPRTSLKVAHAAVKQLLPAMP
jgi:hypothetical protein